MGSSGEQRAFFDGAQLIKTAMQTGGSLDEAGDGRAGPVHTADISGNGGSFVFGLKCKEPNMAKVLGPLDPLDSILHKKILDG